jgi:hypothetical protein
MEINTTTVVVAVIFGGALLGFFLTKKSGWGQYTSALLLLLLILFLAGIAFCTGKIDWPNISGLLLAIAGYAAGLVSPKDAAPDSSGSPR